MCQFEWKTIDKQLFALLFFLQREETNMVLAKKVGLRTIFRHKTLVRLQGLINSILFPTPIKNRSSSALHTLAKTIGMVYCSNLLQAMVWHNDAVLERRKGED